MSNAVTQTMGGLVLQCNELINILDEPGIIGLAFAVQKPGLATNVDLEVFKVTQIDNVNGLVGEAVPISDKQGAASYDDFASGVELYNFEYSDQLISCEFHFAYIEKAKFLDLIKDGEPEVFISGCIKDYGSTGAITGVWFSLKMEPRKDVAGESNTLELGIPPDSYFMSPCPPFWIKQ